MKIVDCFIFNDELKMLEFRLKELYECTDHFVIVEATRTFKGDKKVLQFETHKEQFKAYLDKIIYVVVDDLPDGTDPWEREYFQRNCIDRGISRLSLEDNDLIVICDCDEVTDSSIIKIMRTTNFSGIISLRQDFYYYNFESRIDSLCDISKLMDYKTYKLLNRTPQVIRWYPTEQTILNAGWHLSYFGGTQKIIEKIKAYSHQEFNNDTVVNELNIQKSIEEKRDLLHRANFKIINIPLNENKYLPTNYKMFT